MPIKPDVAGSAFLDSLKIADALTEIPISNDNSACGKVSLETRPCSARSLSVHGLTLSLRLLRLGFVLPLLGLARTMRPGLWQQSGIRRDGTFFVRRGSDAIIMRHPTSAAGTGRQKTSTRL